MNKGNSVFFALFSVLQLTFENTGQILFIWFIHFYTLHFLFVVLGLQGAAISSNKNGADTSRGDELVEKQSK